MAAVLLAGQRLPIAPGQSVLDTLLAAGIDIAHGCGVGVCARCLVRTDPSLAPEHAQRPLRPALRARGYLLACQCRPNADLPIEQVDAEAFQVSATVVDAETIAPEICRLRLEPDSPFAYQAGQFIHLRAPDGAVRAYSLASLPERDRYLELHVARIPGGRVSGWLHAQVRAGDRVTFSGPCGDAVYSPGREQAPILAIATGTGLAPLLAVVRDALASGHRRPLSLYHGARSVAGLYGRGWFDDLLRDHADFAVHHCLSGPGIGPAESAADAEIEPIRPEDALGLRRGRALDLALVDHPDLRGWRVYLCGHPDMVRAGRKRAYLAGAAMADILGDPFLST